MHNLIKIFLSALALVLTFTAQSIAEPLVEGVSKTKFGAVPVKDGEDKAMVSVTGALKFSMLFGEPVVACAAKWELASVTIDGKIYSKGEKGEGIPEDVWNQAYMYDADGLFVLGFHGRGSKEGVKPKGYNLKSAKMYMPCDLGVLGPPDGETVSYNVAGSPDWDGLLIEYTEIPEMANLGSSVYQDRYIPEDDAKTFIKHFVNPNYTPKVGVRLNKDRLTRVGEYMGLADAKVNLHPIRNYIESQKGVVDKVFSKASDWLADLTGDSEGETDSSEEGASNNKNDNLDTANQRELDRRALLTDNKAKSPQDLSGNLDNVTGEIMKATTDVGRLVIRSDVADDRVYINDEHVGQSGPEPHVLRTGKYSVRVEKDGLEQWQKRVEVTTGETKAVRARLMETGENFVVFTGAKNRKGYKDKNGNIVIPARFTQTSEFDAGYAEVYMEGWRHGVIDVDGEFVLGPSDETRFKLEINERGRPIVYYKKMLHLGDDQCDIGDEWYRVNVYDLRAGRIIDSSERCATSIMWW